MAILPVMERAGFVVRIGVVAVTVAAFAVSASCAELELTSSDGERVVWSSWLADRGPAAVLLWASWVPRSGDALGELDGLAAAARQADLVLVVVAVQEPLEDARRALGGRDVVWLHDRYGQLLKELRVVKIPRLVVVDRDGGIERVLPAEAAALRNPEGS